MLQNNSMTQFGFGFNPQLRRFFLALVLLESGFALRLAHGQSAVFPIPTNRTVPWIVGKTVGVVGGIPNRTTQTDVTRAPYSADWTGTKSAGAAIQAALNAAKVNTVVYLPAGVYLVSNTLAIPSDVTLRGAGMTNTVIRMVGSGSVMIGDDWSFTPTSTPILGSAPRGGTNLLVADTSKFTVGTLIKVTMLNDTNQWDSIVTVHVSSYTGIRRQMVQVVAKTSTAITVWPPLYEDCTGGLAWYGQSRRAGGVGLEDLTLDGNGKATAQRAVVYIGLVGSWMKNVKCYNFANYILDWEWNANCELRECWIDNPGAQSGPNHGGFKLVNCSGILCEDNAIAHTFPDIEVNQGTCGSVFAYNFCYDSRSGTANGPSIDGNHDPHNRFNLYEGNIAPNFMSDGYYGSSSQDTIFRNWLHGTQPGISNSYCAALKRFSRGYSFIGNIIGTNGATVGRFSYGGPNIGNGYSDGYGPPWADWRAMLTNAPGSGPGPSGFQELDTNVAPSTIAFANYYFCTNGIPPEEAAGAITIPPSLYLTAKPTWWNTSPWPPFNSANVTATLSFTNIPAGSRWSNASWFQGLTDNGGLEPPFNLRVIGAAVQ